MIFWPIFIVAIHTADATEPKPKPERQKLETPHAHSEDDHDHKHDESTEKEKGGHAHKEGSEAHDHSHEEGEKGHDHAHKDGDGDDHGHAHGEEEEQSASVGPDKGIVEANDESGFKLSPEAFKNFELKFVNVSSGTLTLPRSAIVLAGEETNLFRMRKDFFKRIDFKIVRQSEKEIVVQSKDLSPGDQIVVAGLGFLRIAELAAFGGVAHGHSH